MEFSFQVDVSTDSATGNVISVYFQMREGKAATVREFEKGNVFVNYDKDGNLLGIEMLAPAKISVLDKITRGHPEMKRFVRRTVPRQMVGAVA